MNKILIIAALIAFTSASCNHKASTVKIGSHIISVDVANTEALREQGLSGRASLGVDSGMLFVFDSADIYGFWMKNMNFPLDFIWIDAQDKIVDLTQNISPNTYPQMFYPKSAVKYVVEVNAGWVAKNQVKVGDNAAIDLK